MPVLSTVERNSLASRAVEYHEQLQSPSGSSQLAYLTEDRGLTQETIQRFLLGAVVSPVESDEPARGKISIPYMTGLGPVAIRFRAMPGMEGPKYYQPKGSALSIFNVPQFTVAKSWIVVTEGEIDAMTAVQCGLPAVGLPGVSSWRDHYGVIFDGYERVIILADNDDKGQGQKFADTIAEEVPAPAIFLMPDGHDVNSFVKEHGRAALLDHLKIKNL